MNVFNTKFQYYSANIHDNSPKGVVTLSQFVNAVMKPKPHIVQIMNEIRKAAEEKNTERKTQLKESLYFFTPCVFVQGKRKYDCITHFTGLMVLDFDKLESRELAEQMKEAFFYSVEETVFAWLSSSGKGFRAILQIPTVKSTDEFKTYFAAAQQKFGDLYGFDPAPKNSVLPLFLSIDKNALVRTDSVLFLDTYVEPPPVKQTVRYERSNEDHKVLKMIENKINSITDAGHPIVRATSYYVGGLVAQGLCQEHDAIRKLEDCIRSHHYTGNRAKVNTYLRTMREMFEKGKLNATNFIVK